MNKIKEYFKQEFGKEKNLKTLKLKNSECLFDMRIFQAIILILVISMTTIFIMNDFKVAKGFYVECKTEHGRCLNTLYNNPQCYKYFGEAHYLCNTQLLDNGYTYGNPPNPIIEYFKYFATALIIFAFILNHLIHNKNSEIKKTLKDMFNENESDKDN